MLPGYHPYQVRVLEMPDKGRLLCATPPLRMSRQPFRLALNGRDFVSSDTSRLFSLTPLLPYYLTTLLPDYLTTLLPDYLTTLLAYYLPLTTFHVLPTAYCSPRITDSSLLTAHYSLLTAYRLPLPSLPGGQCHLGEERPRPPPVG